MAHWIALNYAALERDGCGALDALFDVSDAFSLVAVTRHPYAERNCCIHDALLRSLAPFLTAQRAGIREWPGTQTRDCHRVLNMYRACAAARDRLKAMGNVFDIEQRLPEDLCFYRAGQAVFYTVTHEEMAFIAADLAHEGRFAAYR